MLPLHLGKPRVRVGTLEVDPRWKAARAAARKSLIVEGQDRKNEDNEWEDVEDDRVEVVPGMFPLVQMMSLPL
jgi:hypothetical protein